MIICLCWEKIRDIADKELSHPFITAVQDYMYKASLCMEMEIDSMSTKSYRVHGNNVPAV